MGYHNIQSLLSRVRPQTLRLCTIFDNDAEDEEGNSRTTYIAWIQKIDHAPNEADVFEDLIYEDVNIELALGGLDEAIEHWIIEQGLQAIDVMFK